jgi:hypothetical protein
MDSRSWTWPTRREVQSRRLTDAALFLTVWATNGPRGLDALSAGWPLSSAAPGQHVEDQKRNDNDCRGDSDDRDGGSGYDHKAILAWKPVPETRARADGLGAHPLAGKRRRPPRPVVGTDPVRDSRPANPDSHRGRHKRKAVRAGSL